MSFAADPPGIGGVTGLVYFLNWQNVPANIYSLTAVATDPAMTNLYVTYLNALMAAGMSGPFNQYTHVGSCWGLKMATGDSNANAPKYQGVLNWLAAHP